MFLADGDRGLQNRVLTFSLLSSFFSLALLKLITPAVALPQLVREKLKGLHFSSPTAPAPATISISHVTGLISRSFFHFFISNLEKLPNVSAAAMQN